MVIQGVIRPPPEIRAVADRTASYVAKNGRAFETRILSSSKGKTPKFAFLQPNNPFHAYYQERIQFYENGGQDGEDDDENKKQGTTSSTSSSGDKDDKNKSLQTAETAAATTTSQQQQQQGQNIQSKATHSAIDPVAKALLSHRTRIAKLKVAAANNNKKPQDDHAASTGEEASPQATTTMIPPPAPLHFIHIIPPASLTVVQLETIQLVAQLTALDGKGGTFLGALTRREWNNPLYAFCQPRHGHFAYFSALVDAYRHVISTWTTKTTNSSTSTTTASKDDGDEQDAHLGPTAGIKEMSNNAQTCLQVVAYRAEYHRHLAEERQRMSSNNTADATPAAMIDWHDFVVVETIDFAKDEQVVTLPPPPPADIQPPKPTTTVATKGDDMQDSDDDDEAQEQIRVVPTYQPKVVSASASTLETVIDPSTGQRVRVQDVPEHMRIRLMDPKWAEERKKFQDKQKDSNLVGGDVVANNLARLAQARGIANKDVLDTEEDAKKRLQDANRFLREQALDPKTKVGPALPHAEPKRPPPEATVQPDAKRPRVTEVLPPPPPPPPLPPGPTAPPGYSGFGSAAPVDPFVAAASGEGAPTGAATASSSMAGGPAPQTQSEADFMASLPKPEVTLQVRIPNDPAQMAWNFYGQIVSLTVHAMTNIKSVKQELSRQHLNQMPINKIQLKMVTTGAFLNNNNASLAALNLGPTATLELLPKTRGGRK